MLEADLKQVTKVMGFEDLLDITDDIGSADAILASSSELRQNPWIRGAAKFHQLPVFVLKVPFCHSYTLSVTALAQSPFSLYEILFLSCSPIPWHGC